MVERVTPTSRNIPLRLLQDPGEVPLGEDEMLGLFLELGDCVWIHAHLEAS